jgi:RimJ/RimL family protein N-acetyltransferase
LTTFCGVEKLSTANKKLRTFKCLPTRITDRRGRLLHVRAYEDADLEGLRDMYDTFEPKGLECGLPPAEERVRAGWINYVVSDLFNVITLHKALIIGHIALDLSCAPSCPEYLIFIRKSFRNCGIGTALSALTRELAKEAGCEKVVVTVRTANTRAIKVFEKVGFVFRGKIEAERDMELCLLNKTHREKSKSKAERPS